MLMIIIIIDRRGDNSFMLVVLVSRPFPFLGKNSLLLILGWEQRALCCPYPWWLCVWLEGGVRPFLPLSRCPSLSPSSLSPLLLDVPDGPEVSHSHCGPQSGKEKCLEKMFLWFYSCSSGNSRSLLQMCVPVLVILTCHGSPSQHLCGVGKQSLIKFN